MKTGQPTPLEYFTAPPARRARFVAWVFCVAGLIGGTGSWLFLLRGERIIDHDVALIGGWYLLGACVFATGVLLKSTPRDSIRLSMRSGSWLCFCGALALQAASFVLLTPSLSEDLLRYRMDGRTWLRGSSPYAFSPVDFAAAQQLSPDDALNVVAVPHRGLHTIYPPTAQVCFVTGRVLDEWIPEGLPARGFATQFSGWSYRVIATVGGLLCVVVLLSILAIEERSRWHAVLLAWSPLFVIETGGMGHVDIVGVLFVLLAIRALQSRRPILATAMLALAAGVKPHVVLLAPFLLRDALAVGSRVQLKWLAVAFVGFLALVYSPMLYHQGYKGWLKTSHIYATSWEANGSIYDLIKSTADETDGVAVQRAKDRARALAGVAVVVTMLIMWFARADLATAGYWIFLVALLFSPVVYPWYLLWVLCFVPLLRAWQGITALVWAATVGVSYLLWRTSDWVLPTRWLLVEYVPVYAALLIELASLLIGSLNHRSIESLEDGNAPSPITR